MTVQRAQRVGVFVDVQNIYYAARFVYNAKVNYGQLLGEVVKGRTLIRALAYVIRTEEVSREPFFQALGNIGFEVKAKDLQVFADGTKKGDWDIGIAMDAIELAPRLDVIVLVSGDGDFVPLIEHLKRALGCRVEVAAFGRSTSQRLKEAADSFTDFDTDLNKFIVRGKDGRQPDVRLKPIELANIPGIGGPGPRKHEGPLKRPAASGEPHPGEYGRPRIPRPQRARPMRRNQGPRRPQQKKEAYGFPD